MERKVVTRFMEGGLYLFTKRYLGTFKNHFSTIGVNGMNEMVRNFTNDNCDITSQEGKDLVIRILDHIRAKLVEFQVETGHLYNLEATPPSGIREGIFHSRGNLLIIGTAYKAVSFKRAQCVGQYPGGDIRNFPAELVVTYRLALTQYKYHQQSPFIAEPRHYISYRTYLYYGV